VEGQAGVLPRGGTPACCIRSYRQDEVIQVSVMSDTKTAMTDVDLVDQWRWDQALRMGCDPGLADQIVRHTEVDLHKLEAMIKGGSPPELAFYILKT
jgi:hypothetical protein